MEKNYRISFRIGESSFEIESTDAKWLETKEKQYFEKLGSKAPRHRGKPEAETGQEQQEILLSKGTLNEFYRKYVQRIKSRPSIAVFFVYYLQNIMKKDKISTSDVIKCFKEISYPNWNKLNVTYILTSARRRALVNYVNKLWYVTTTGEDYVLNTISGKRK